MTHSRTVFVVALALVAVPATAATAKKKPKISPRSQVVCNLVTDVRGDADKAPFGVTESPTGNEAAYDIVSADVATDDRTMTAVVRVAHLAPSTANAPTGMHWRVDFAVVGSSSSVFLQAFSTPFGTDYDVGYVDGGTSNSIEGAGVTGLLDVPRGEVRISAPLAAVAKETVIVKGSTLSQIRASAGRFYNTLGTHPSVTERTDDAWATRTYVAGSRSCVAVGR